MPNPDTASIEKLIAEARRRVQREITTSGELHPMMSPLDLLPLCAALESVVKERDALREALEAAGGDICSEYCGSSKHHGCCIAVTAALDNVGGIKEEK